MSRMVTGGIVALIGIIVTVGSYEAASGGGTYVVAWGAILFGGIQFLRGLGELAQSTGSSRESR